MAKLDPPLFDYTEGALDSIVRKQNQKRLFERDGGRQGQARPSRSVKSARNALGLSETNTG